MAESSLLFRRDDHAQMSGHLPADERTILRTILETTPNGIAIIGSGGLLDKSLRRGLVLSDGSLRPFFTRPISIALASAILLTVLLQAAPVRSALMGLVGWRRVRAGD